MRNVGKIKEIWRYPVKGMAGERLEASALGEKGLSGDRIWALRDTTRKEIQSCKFRPDLLLCSARCEGASAAADTDGVYVTFPDGSVLSSGAAQIHAKLSHLIGHSSTLEPFRPDTDRDFYRRHKLDDHTWLRELAATFDREAGEPIPDFSQLPPPLVDFVSIPGSFFLVTPLHIVTTATLARLKEKNPGADWDARRFRPNLLIETNVDAEGFVEQEWLGKRLAIGDAAVDCAGATPRCGAVTRAQPNFPADKTILRTVVKDADQNVGVYGLIASPGTLRVGDVVYIDG
ncbi:MAG: MOSC N-terminal beta barrel domain-containing protein [Betaproteobacteria bacterium]